MSLKSLALVGLAVGGFTVSLLAQAPASSGNSRVEGHWVRTDTAGAGSFGGLASGFTPAALTPQAEAGARAGGRGGGAGPGRGADPAVGPPNPTGVPYIVVERPCGNPAGRGNGALLISPDSGGIHFIEHKDEVIIAGERGGVRHIYLDGRPHPPLEAWTPTPAGHSIGHYEGEVLVVDTVGLTPGGVVAGGQRSPETHLKERFLVAPDGKTMTIVYTWDDPRIYQRPHSYTYTFDRLPPMSYAFEEWCDASDPLEKQSVVPPRQQ